MTPAAPWSPRDKAGVVVFNDELYLLGGQGTADVWRSSNGRDWTQLVAEADWSPRHDFARLVYSGRLWVFGGWTDRSTNALNDVWYSDDGMTGAAKLIMPRGHRDHRSPLSSTTRSGSTAASTPAPTTTGAAMCGR